MLIDTVPLPGKFSQHALDRYYSTLESNQDYAGGLVKHRIAACMAACLPNKRQYAYYLFAHVLLCTSWKWYHACDPTLEYEVQSASCGLGRSPCEPEMHVKTQFPVCIYDGMRWNLH